MQSQQPEVDGFKEKVQEILKRADQRNRQLVGKENIDINQQWNNLIKNLDKKYDDLTLLVERWTDFENKLKEIENKITSTYQRFGHIDLIIRSKKQQEEIKNSLEVSVHVIFLLTYLKKNVFLK